jgi:acetyl esterase
MAGHDGLAPEVAAVVQQLNASFPRLGTEVTDAAQARAMYEGLRRPPASITPVRAVTDHVIAGTTLRVRRYSPVGEPTCVIVFCHGGGWVLGGLDSHDEICRRLAVGASAIVVAVDYRLAPEHPFPAALEDAYLAVEHVGVTDGLSLPLIVCGDSAGGHVAAGAAILARDRRGPTVAGQALLYPVIEPRCTTSTFADYGAGHFLTTDHMRWFWRQYLGADPHEDNVLVSLADGDLTGLPPTDVVTAEFDPLRAEGEHYATRLVESGVPVSARRYAGMFHGFLGFATQLSTAEHALMGICRAIRALAVADD